MRDSIVKRTIDEAEYIIENKATVRAAAKFLGISKSTIHTDITKRLPFLDVGLYDDVKILMDFNFSVRHIRGGEATKTKYKGKDGL